MGIVKDNSEQEQKNMKQKFFEIFGEIDSNLNI